MAKGTETLKEARDIIEEMNLNIDRFNQGLKDSDGFTKKMTNNIAETLQGLHDSRKANKMNGKQLGAVADLGKEILDGNIDAAKSKRLQESLQAKLNKKMSKGQEASIRNQITLLQKRDHGEKIQKRVNLATEVGDKLTGGMASKAGGFLKNLKKAGPVAMGVGLAAGLIVKAFTFASSMVDSIGKTFGAIVNTSSAFRDNVMDASIDVISIGKSGADVNTVIDELTKNFGISLDAAAELSTKVLDTAVALGLSTEEGAKLFGTLMQIGNLSALQAERLAESTYQLAQQNNVNPNAVMKDIADSAEMVAKFGAENVDSLAKAAVKARQLGLNLSTVGKIADSLLNFQSSLTAEIEASAMIGKQLNLQKAREFALTGDTSAMMDEVLNQLGREAHQLADNVLARQSLAAAVGVEVTELEKLINAQDKSIVQAKSFNDLAGSDALSALTSITNKIKEIGATLLQKLGTPLSDLLKDFEKRFFTDENIARVEKFIGGFLDTMISVGKTIANIVGMFAGVSDFFDFSLVGILKKLINFNPISLVASFFTGKSMTSMIGVDDVKSSGGSHLIVTPSGQLVKTNPKDTVFATTKRVNDGILGGNEGDLNFGSDMSGTEGKLDRIIELTETLISDGKKLPEGISRNLRGF
tara:strand:+ start:1167 stop:3095 length:1929 start_codon:yes stop_codon:yes gene_type:complete